MFGIGIAFLEIFLILILIGSKSDVLCPCFLNGMSLKIRYVRVLSLDWGNSHALIKYLNDRGNIMNILVIIIWFGIFSEFAANIFCKVLELYDMSSYIFF